MFDDSRTTRERVITMIWTQIRQYFYIGWEQYKEKVMAGKLSKARAWFLFTAEYGQDTCLFSLEDSVLRVPYKAYGVF
jgi:hypothetical protein